MTVPPFAPDRLVPFAPAELRPLPVFGAPAFAAHVPTRKLRQDRPSAERPAFRRSPAPRIVGEESLWQADGLVLTANKYPFARDQRILWPAEARREPHLAMWTAICAWVDGSGGSALVNTVGAAASIARAHAHLSSERLPFLAALRERPAPADLVDLPPGVQLIAKDVPFCLLGVRGPAEARALAVWRLAEARMTAAWNVVVQDGTAWLYPRSAETPAPHFPYPLGAAEVWGRWCYVDREPFAAATGAMLEQALVVAGTKPL